MQVNKGALMALAVAGLVVAAYAGVLGPGPARAFHAIGDRIGRDSDGDDFDLLRSLEDSAARADAFFRSAMKRSGYGQNAEFNRKMEAHGYNR